MGAGTGVDGFDVGEMAVGPPEGLRHGVRQEVIALIFQHG